MLDSMVRDGDYVCKHCKLVYKVYGSRLRCDLCNRKLKWCGTGLVNRLLEKWGDNAI